MNFWNRETEITFFREAPENLATPKQLFYTIQGKCFAYAPKGTSTDGYALQARNTLIGRYTERWAQAFLEPIARHYGLYALTNVVCKELGLTPSSGADIAFCTKKEIRGPEDIKLIFEVKMSIVHNYLFNPEKGSIDFVGDYTTHKGAPSLLRSDSILKAIGKAITIRVANPNAVNIPIIVLGNSPISQSYIAKVEALKEAGIVQGFVSLYPSPTKNCITLTPKRGFQTFKDYPLLQSFIGQLIAQKMVFISTMMPAKTLGAIIATAARKATEEEKAKELLQLLQQP